MSVVCLGPNVRCFGGFRKSSERPVERLMGPDTGARRGRIALACKRHAPPGRARRKHDVCRLKQLLCSGWSPFAPRKSALLTYFRGAKADHPPGKPGGTIAQIPLSPRHSGLPPAEQQLSGYPMVRVFSHLSGTPEIRLNSSRQNDLLWASCAAKIITTIRDHWRGVAAQLLPRRDKPDGSNPAWLCCL
jgi:hypothetical protein